MRGEQAYGCLCFLLLAAITSSGCMDAGSNGIQGTAVDPSTLQAPSWQVGDAWHYATAEGAWQNWTVVGLDERNGYKTYRLELTNSNHDEFVDYEKAIVWLNRSTLGLVADRADDGTHLTAEPPMNQLFPIINRTYDTTMNINFNSPQKIRFHQQVEGWHRISTPAGEFDTVLMLVQREVQRSGGEPIWLDEEPIQIWYSLSVGNTAQFYSDGELYQIMSWKHGQ